MMEETRKKLLAEAEEKMIKAQEHLEHEFNTVRTGRANPAVLDSIRVSAYGSELPLNQVATVNTPDARTITVSPFDRNQLGAIERAIIAANLGMNPSNDGSLLRIIIPALTEERRKEMCKMAAKMAEEARVAIRHIRKHANDEIKRLEKDHDVPEDLAKQLHDKIQKLTDDHIKQVDTMLAKKEKAVMEV